MLPIRFDRSVEVIDSVMPASEDLKEMAVAVGHTNGPVY